MFRNQILSFVFAATCLLLTGHLSAQEDDIRGPRGPVAIPMPEKTSDALWWGLAAGVLTVAVVMLIWKKRKRGELRKSPLALALGSLTELASTRETLPAEAFANRAAQTVRHYIAAQFGLAAPRRTTEEFLNDLARDNSSPLLRESDHLRVFLKSCDLAKFAGSNLNAKQRDELLDAARRFVEATSAPVIPTNSPAPTA
jgi:hypothetical protein